MLPKSRLSLFFVNIAIASIFFQHLDYFFCQHLNHLHFFQIADPAAAYHYGITTLPTLVYFKNSVPNLFDGEADFSNKREKSNVMSARKIFTSSEENLERLKRPKVKFVKIWMKYWGCRQRVVLSGRLTDAPDGRCQRVNTPINPDKV